MTDKLLSYEAAKQQVLKSVEHRYSQGVEQPLRRIPINQLECEKDGCDDSNPLGKPNAFFLLLDRFEDTFTPNNINSPHNAIANNCVNAFKIGEKSRLLNLAA